MGEMGEVLMEGELGEVEGLEGIVKLQGVGGMVVLTSSERGDGAGRAQKRNDCISNGATK